VFGDLYTNEILLCSSCSFVEQSEHTLLVLLARRAERAYLARLARSSSRASMQVVVPRTTPERIPYTGTFLLGL